MVLLKVIADARRQDAGKARKERHLVYGHYRLGGEHCLMSEAVV